MGPAKGWVKACRMMFNEVYKFVICRIKEKLSFPQECLPLKHTHLTFAFIPEIYRINISSVEEILLELLLLPDLSFE